MSKQKQDLKILYMQVRSDEETAEEEFGEFIRYSGLARGQFTVWNVFKQPHIDTALADEHDALFVGGSSDDPEDMVGFDPKRFPFIVDAKKLIRHCIDHDIPTFASCIGFQIAVEVLGGEVVFDKVHMEMGTYHIHLTEAGKKDVLFAGTPDTFLAVSGHKKRAAAVPDGCELLAYSDLCPFHAVKVVGKLFYGFQFHPEVDKKDLVARLSRYLSRYFSDEKSVETLKHVMETCEETPEANALVAAFINRIVLGKSAA